MLKRRRTVAARRSQPRRDAATAPPMQSSPTLVPDPGHAPWTFLLDPWAVSWRTITRVHSHPGFGRGQEYGYGIWLHTEREPPVFGGMGRGGQHISVVTGVYLVVILTGRGFEPGDIGEILGCAQRSDQPRRKTPLPGSRRGAWKWLEPGVVFWKPSMPDLNFGIRNTGAAAVLRGNSTPMPAARHDRLPGIAGRMLPSWLLP